MSRPHRVSMPTAASVALAVALAATIALANGCGPKRRGSPLTEPLQITSQTLAVGQRAFMQHCHQCHPGGSGGLGPSINDKPLPQFLIRTQVRSGLGAMPAFDQQHIPDDEVEAIAVYLRELRTLRRRPLQ
jgi:mono/diheme cytochrome c family protein